MNSRWGVVTLGMGFLLATAPTAVAQEEPSPPAPSATPVAPVAPRAPAAKPAPSAAASAAPPAPVPVLTTLRKRAAEELRALLAPMDKSTRDRLAGIYVASNGTMADLGAMAACDDDGDYVVVITDGLLMLLDAVAHAQASDELLQTHKLDAYAAYLAKAQRPNARLVPPPGGMFDPPSADTGASARLEELRVLRVRDALAGVLAHEVAHMLAGDVTCRHPTATRESGDDQWTASEQSQAEGASAAAYTQQRVLAADTLGTDLLLEAGRTTGGLMATLAVIARLEQSGREGYAPSYIRMHAGTGARMQWVEAAASHFRYTHPSAR